MYSATSVFLSWGWFPRSTLRAPKTTLSDIGEPGWVSSMQGLKNVMLLEPCCARNHQSHPGSAQRMSGLHYVTRGWKERERYACNTGNQTILMLPPLSISPFLKSLSQSWHQPLSSLLQKQCFNISAIQIYIYDIYIHIYLLWRHIFPIHHLYL